MVVSDSLKSHEWTADKNEMIMAQLDAYFPTLVLACTVYSGVTALFSFLMVLGVKCESRCLMIPFLVLSMIDIIVAGTAGGVVVEVSGGSPPPSQGEMWLRETCSMKEVP